MSCPHKGATEYFQLGRVSNAPGVPLQQARGGMATLWAAISKEFSNSPRITQLPEDKPANIKVNVWPPVSYFSSEQLYPREAREW